jgi:PAS domain S-box-containing protein
MDPQPSEQAHRTFVDANGLLAALMESAPEAMGFVDASGRLVYATRRFETIFSRPLDGLIGLDAVGFLAAVRALVQDPDAVLGRMRAGMEARQPVALEMRHADGRVFEFSSVPTSTPGALAGHLVQLRDVTHRRDLEARLLHAHKMESIGRLAGGVAHDFNNMLTAMIGYMDLVAADLPPESEDHSYLTQALEAAEQASGLTRQLLAFARRQPVQPSPQDLNALLERMAPLLRRLVPEDIEIETRIDASPGWVLADAGQLEQVLVNLAFNARDAMPEGGLLTLATVREKNPTVEGGEAVVLEVADTGVGIDAEVRDHLFEPFYTTKPDGHGSGLGLATVYGIVQTFGGRIEVLSAPGRGARFRVLLPPTEEPAGHASVNGAARGHETVLLVEDDASVRGLVIAMLGRLGYEVLAAERAEDALELLAQHAGDVDLLIADIIMPGMSGREMATRAQAARPHLRVLLTSGHAAPSSGPQLAAGFAFMPKPFSIETLAVRVREALASGPDQAGLPQ